MAITSLDGLINGFTPPVNFMKTFFTSEGAGTYASYWGISGNPGSGYLGPAFNAGDGYNCDATTRGALRLPSYPTDGAKMYLARASVGAANAGTTIIYDRLWHCTGFLLNTTSTQTINTPGTLPPRDALGTSSGVGVEAWGYIITAGGATAANWKIIYTNASGDSPRTGIYQHPNNAESVWQTFPFTLQGDDNGIRSVESVITSNTATAGNMGLVLLRRYAEIVSNVAGIGSYQDAITLGLPEIPSGACLGLMTLCSSTVAATIVGSLTVATG